MRAPWPLLALTLGLLACGSRGGGDGDDDGTTYARLVLEPETVELTVAIGSTGSQDYKVFGVRDDDSRVDITDTCVFDLADSSFGSFTAATVTVAPRGGKTNVNAGCSSQTATGVLLVNLGGNVIGPGAPDNAAELFENATAGTDPARVPALEYPLDKAVSPRNIPPVEVQYKTAGNDLFHVTMTSTFASVHIYTGNAEALLAEADWAAVAQTAVGENLTFSVEALLQSDPSTKFVSVPHAVTMSRDTIDQTAIYWWSSNQGSILSQVFGNTGAPELVKDDCTSCHSVSRAGSRIGYSRCVNGNCGEQMVGFMKFNGATNTWEETVNANAKQYPGSYTTFAPVGNPYPDDSRSLAVMNQVGSFQLIDPDTGTLVASNINEIASASNTKAPMMPDWSADGTKVTYTQGQPGQYVDVGDGRIAVMSYQHDQAADTHTFSNATVITPSPITVEGVTFNNFFFPSFSSDNELIVFNATPGYWRNSNADGRLMLTTPTGAWISDLTAMNGGLNNGITWPHWAPTVSTEYYWVVFSSERDYGHRSTIATSQGTGCIANGVRQCKQIWLGAIAKSKLGQGVDPSAPPMWLPGQQPTANNLSPFWTRPAVIQ